MALWRDLEELRRELELSNEAVAVYKLQSVKTLKISASLED